MSINKNFFMVPHQFEEIYGSKLTISQKYFYIILIKLTNRYGSSDGWFWHVDKTFKTKEGNILGFRSFGFSLSTCKRARKKLKELELIETRRAWSKDGFRVGTFYNVKDEVFGGTRYKYAGKIDFKIRGLKS